MSKEKKPRKEFTWNSEERPRDAFDLLSNKSGTKKEVVQQEKIIDKKISIDKGDLL